MFNLFRSLKVPSQLVSQVDSSSMLRAIVEVLETRNLFSVAAPTGLTAIGTSASTIALHWNVVADASVTGYDVFSRRFISNGGGKGSHGGHYVYSAVGANIKTNADVVTGLLTGSSHTYVVTAVTTSGQSPYSAAVYAQTWFAPTANGFMLSSGAVYSSPVPIRAELTTQLTILAGGNPLNYSLIGAPATASINPKTGVLTYTPASSEVGTKTLNVKISNAVGMATQSITFNIAPSSKLAKPKLKLNQTAFTYSGNYQQVSASAVGKDGITPVVGYFTYAYNGGLGYPMNVGSYQVLATFTSADPKYANATLLTNITIAKATPHFTNLSSSTIALGAASATVTGSVGAGTYPTGDAVTVTLNGVSQSAIVDTFGGFTTTFATSTLKLGTYTVTYAYSGNNNYNPAPVATSKINVIPVAAPKVTLNPASLISTDGDTVSFSAIATGSPTPTVQWQVSTNGGASFTNILNATSTTLSFASALFQNGYKYRAIFTSTAGTSTSAVATLTVEADTGGGA